MGNKVCCCCDKQPNNGSSTIQSRKFITYRTFNNYSTIIHMKPQRKVRGRYHMTTKKNEGPFNPFRDLTVPDYNINNSRRRFRSHSEDILDTEITVANKDFSELAAIINQQNEIIQKHNLRTPNYNVKLSRGGSTKIENNQVPLKVDNFSLDQISESDTEMKQSSRKSGLLKMTPPRKFSEIPNHMSFGNLNSKMNSPEKRINEYKKSTSEHDVISEAELSFGKMDVDQELDLIEQTKFQKIDSSRQSSIQSQKSKKESKKEAFLNFLKSKGSPRTSKNHMKENKLMAIQKIKNERRKFAEVMSGTKFSNMEVPKSNFSSPKESVHAWSEQSQETQIKLILNSKRSLNSDTHKNRNRRCKEKKLPKMHRLKNKVHQITDYNMQILNDYLK